MKKLLSAFITLLFLLPGASVDAQTQQLTATDGSMTFTVQTVTNNATYSPRNVLAIWIKDSQGNFVISRKVMAAGRKQHLVKWNASSGNNSVNAITGATLPNHQTHTISWDCRNLTGNLVEDGVYQVWVEFTERNSAGGGAAGPSFSVSFTKGIDPVSLNIPDESYFKNMTLSYSPQGVGVDYQSGAEFGINLFPNPFSSELNIRFMLTDHSYVNASVYSSDGKRIAELYDGMANRGEQNITWDRQSFRKEKVPAGVYTVRLLINNKIHSRKVVITG